MSQLVFVSDWQSLGGTQVFFCKYNDPIYVKMEKLETIIRLVNDRNIDQVFYFSAKNNSGRTRTRT